ncbi:hypothetical protein [Sinorhizobium meliloti]|uniref:Uncharacterized protein n=1 Tax=Sinorhizobium meliloti (strain SM11) TaxID=707241 RepID=F7XJN9_SINMM|nr:hypothetical protein [Sinorhizobium meliloti]AEH83217.1 hypothetical protein SM11_pD0384 [Sinorhizobium meliloti SM11]MDE3786695.1 hypothetical protein [Sinorhizobium meliloti]MDE3795243.1 hypothetical protein [Sinorhizobium meliloti]MDE4561283.1 hypothetical protein [Sinorhizobium meliloti SM11]MDE4599222.1 hypothetical protein [Sinorhizobium meliloti]
MDELRKEGSPAEEDRREFLKACGRFAAVTPPAVTMLLSTSLTSDAIAASGSGASGGKGGGGGNSAKGGKGGNGTKGGKGGNNAKGKAKPGK